MADSFPFWAFIVPLYLTPEEGRLKMLDFAFEAVGVIC